MWTGLYPGQGWGNRAWKGVRGERESNLSPGATSESEARAWGAGPWLPLSLREPCAAAPQHQVELRPGHCPAGT